MRVRACPEASWISPRGFTWDSTTPAAESARAPRATSSCTKAWSPATNRSTRNSINSTKRRDSPQSRASGASACPMDRATSWLKYLNGIKISPRKRNTRPYKSFRGLRLKFVVARVSCPEQTRRVRREEVSGDCGIVWGLVKTSRRYDGGSRERQSPDWRPAEKNAIQENGVSRGTRA